MSDPPNFQIAEGWDRLNPQRFTSQYHQHVHAISRKVLAGRYLFRPSLSAKSKKPDGGHRTLAWSGMRDGLVERSLAKVLYPAIDARLTSDSYAYRAGKTCHQAVARLCRETREGLPYYFESDFRSFFDTLDHDRLRGLIWSLKIDERAKVLAWRKVRTGHLPARELRDERRQYPESRNRGVPQGGVISGLMANLYLARFDQRMREVAPSYIRYADDFIALAGSEDKLAEIEAVARAAAAEVKAELHPRKTHKGHIDDRAIEFLGFRLRGTKLSIKDANVQKYQNAVINKLNEQVGRVPWSEDDLDRLGWGCWHVNRVILGHRWEDEVRRGFQLRALREATNETHSKLAYFRIVNDVEQLRSLDRWTWKYLQAWLRAKAGLGAKQVKYVALREAHDDPEKRLRNITTEYRQLRRRMDTDIVPYEGFVDPGRQRALRTARTLVEQEMSDEVEQEMSDE